MLGSVCGVSFRSVSRYAVTDVNSLLVLSLQTSEESLGLPFQDSTGVYSRTSDLDVTYRC
jgi:hypothetical protein